jgi:hypothetical protein
MYAELTMHCMHDNASVIVIYYYNEQTLVDLQTMQLSSCYEFDEYAIIYKHYNITRPTTCVQHTKFDVLPCNMLYHVSIEKNSDGNDNELNCYWTQGTKC